AMHLEYKQTDDCYGGFQEIGCDEYNFNLDCKLLRRSLDKARLAHVGYGAILAFDADVDHKKDLLISKVDCPTINYLKNIGSPQTPTYQQAISKLSEKDTFQLAGFPNPFAVDVDGDGQQELVITPGTISSGFVLNFETSNYLFDKSLNLINTAFIQDQTIDLGEHTAPTSYDYDADGDQDLLVGYTTYKLNTKYRGGIALFENIQTDAEPIWVLRELDYKHLSEYQWVHITPQIFDVNNDGNTDLLITASSPQHLLNTYTFVYYGTTTGVSSSLDTLSIPLNFTDTPYFTRFNNQVKALVGKAKGTLMLYNKAGQTWILEKDSLGFTPTSDIKETVVCEANVDGDSLEDLLLCNSLKKLLYVQNYKTKGLSNWKIDTLLFYSNIDQQTYPIQLSRKSKLHSIFKIGSKSDIWAGSVAGGLYHFKSHDQHIASKDYQSIYPNPFFDELIIKSQHEDYYKLYELSGKLLEQGPIYKGHNLLSLPHLLAGVYILKLTTESKLIIKK
ncbi:MAG TPA: T9SS type A sorting domain-containing protein, partial [Cytophagales bacterium]|nr:T9SS type A sorting domain-containing protein [Cytophagales bacterium]